MTGILRLPGIATQTITIKRKSAGSYINSRWVEGTEQSFRITGSEQPVSGRELLALPEGERVKTVLKVYTGERLYTAREAESKTADIIVINGADYKVVKVWPYKVGNNFGYNKVLAVDIVDGN